MKHGIAKWIRIHVNKVAGSIAFIPAVIAIGFLLLSWGMLEIDFSGWGKQVKSTLTWLTLKDASTARSIISTVAGAIISLTVFSFSMVMIVLNQAASQMSNRVLSSMIENRFQQVVLGFYIGTIVYALFLLTTIRDINSGIYVPALSIYLLILLTVIDIFLFIYFLDYVTQTVKYETVIRRVERQTFQTMQRKFCTGQPVLPAWEGMSCTEIATPESNYYQGFKPATLVSLAAARNCYIAVVRKEAEYLLKNTVFARIYAKDKPGEACVQAVTASFDFFKGQPIDVNADYGFNQLAEVAIKALSPGINDPATAVISIHALTSLFAHRLVLHPQEVFADSDGVARVTVYYHRFEGLFRKCIYPIWNYGKNDQYVQDGLLDMLRQLKGADKAGQYVGLFNTLANKIQKTVDQQTA
jgi:uncharacterized membrane protein